jgi:hypothetical protein
LDGKDMRIENVTKFGRDFSVVSVPYSLKLLLQELQTANVQMRIITEDNIQQLENMSFSKNIKKLLHDDAATPETVITDIKMKLRATEVPGRTPESPAFNPISPDYPPTSPAYNPQSPDYPPTSPAYNPQSPDYPPTSPAYNPQSPDYPPTSPAYNPESPPYNPVFDPDSPPFAPDFIPEFNPTTPDEPPPATGGGDEYYVGEQVYLRGGKKANRLWNVRNIGSKFITIGTDDMDGIDNLDDSIQVVTPNEIYRPNEVIHDMYPQQMNPGNPFEYQSHPQPEPSKMNFTPVINIVTGNDNKIDGIPSASSEPMNHFVESYTVSMDGHKPVQHNESHNVQSVEKNQPPIENNPIDFTKGLLIKKI